MRIAIERKPRPRCPAVPHSPQHCQAAKFVEPVTGINERCSVQLYILSEELKGSQCPLSTITPFLALAVPVLFYLHLQRRRQLLCCLLLCTRYLYC